MSQKENAALGDAAQERDETERGQRFVEHKTFAVSAREDTTTPRASQTADARRILSPMLRTASRNGWQHVLDALLDLFAKWTQSV